MELKVDALEFRGGRNFFQGVDVSQSQSLSTYYMPATWQALCTSHGLLGWEYKSIVFLRLKGVTH